jgi:tRNA-specific 2-thiouridylase
VTWKLRIITAISGGIDSSFALSLLVKQGHEVVGCFLVMSDGHEEDVDRARRVCELLKVPFYAIDIREKFKSEVIVPLITSYSNGKTPNPCVFCNPNVKFKTLFDLLNCYNADFIATGHYAKIYKNDSNYHLVRGRDPKKEQSYMLYRLPKNWLSSVIFPLGDLTKAEVKKKAREIFGNIFDDVEESADLCFLRRDETLRGFLSSRIDVKEGPILSLQGEFLGSHKGVGYYTVGQRDGLGLPNGPWYVSEINASENVLIVGRKEDLQRRFVKCYSPHWLEGLEIGKVYSAQHRYKTTPKPVALMDSGKEGFTVKALESPFWGVAPGQSLVLYDGDVVVGGGIIAGCSEAKEV